jgi:hypothetical protein
MRHSSHCNEQRLVGCGVVRTAVFRGMRHRSHCIVVGCGVVRTTLINIWVAGFAGAYNPGSTLVDRIRSGPSPRNNALDVDEHQFPLGQLLLGSSSTTCDLEVEHDSTRWRGLSNRCLARQAGHLSGNLVSHGRTQPFTPKRALTLTTQGLERRDVEHRWA